MVKLTQEEDVQKLSETMYYVVHSTISEKIDDLISDAIKEVYSKKKG